MQILQTSLHHHFFFTFPKPLNPNPNPNHRHHRNHNYHHLPWRPFLARSPTLRGNSPANCFSSDEFPVDDTFLESFGPREKETEEEARIRNWTERGWAPWEEVLTPEADFARKSLNEGEEVPLQSPEAIEAFKMLKPSYRKKKMEEMGLTEDDYYRRETIISLFPRKFPSMFQQAKKSFICTEFLVPFRCIDRYIFEFASLTTFFSLTTMGKNQNFHISSKTYDVSFVFLQKQLILTEFLDNFFYAYADVYLNLRHWLYFSYS